MKNLINKHVGGIEPRAGGRSIARASDSTVPALDAATREVLQQKFQVTVFAELNDEFPGVKLRRKGDRKQFAFPVERDAQGRFEFQASSDASFLPLSAATHDEVERRFAEKLIAPAGKHFAQELAPALGAPRAEGDIKVFVKSSTRFTLTEGGNSAAAIHRSGLSNAAGAGARSQLSDLNLAGTYSADDGPISRPPIDVGNSRSSRVIRFSLALLIVAALVSVLFLRHR